MDFFGEWQKLNSDPRFAALDYEKQQELRAKWLSMALPKADGFGNLSPQAQQLTFQKLVSRPPAMASHTEWSDAILGIAEEIRSGTVRSDGREGADTIDLASTILSWRKVRDAGGIFGRFHQGVIASSAVGAGELLTGEDSRLRLALHTPDKGTD